MQSSKPGLLALMGSRLRRMMSSFREKPNTTLDDYLLEHFMLYHGLVGTSPENQPRERDLRADIFDALKHRSSSELGIAIKVAPLWWQEKLPGIWAAAQKEFGDTIISCLLPPGEAFELAPESDPLRHPDWRVRANAARALAQFNATEAVPRMVTALNDEDPTVKTAFCHLAYSLGQLRTPQARMALVPHLQSEEPWFRVDSAGALAKWPLAEVATDLMQAVMEPHALTDYMSVAIAKEHQPAELLRQQDDLLQEGALEIIIGLLQAAKGTFANDLLIECRVQAALPRVVELAEQHGTPRRWRALASLGDWMSANIDDICALDRTASATKILGQVEEARQKFSPAKVAPQLLEWFKSQASTDANGSQLRHAVKLAGELRLKEAAPYVVPLLDKKSPALNEAIDAIGELGETSAAPQLVALLSSVVDTEDRNGRAHSKQPVFEDNPAETKTYWHGLRALGSLPTEDSMRFLIKASRDFAPDKRQQALSSVVALAHDEKLRAAFEKDIVDLMRSGLSDASPTVRTAALQGVGELGLQSLLEDVLVLANAPETAVWRQAATTVKALHADSAAPVEATLSAASDRERDHFKRQRLQKLLAEVRTV